MDPVFSGDSAVADGDVTTLQRLDGHRMGLLLSLLIFTRGFWLWAPWWDTFGASSTTVALGVVASEEVWGWVAMVIGTAGISGALLDHRWLCSASIFAAGVFWTFTALLIGFGSGWQATGPAHFLLFATASWWGFIRSTWGWNGH